jgi:hypothetical protein
VLHEMREKRKIFWGLRVRLLMGRAGQRVPGVLKKYNPQSDPPRAGNPKTNPDPRFS